MKKFAIGDVVVVVDAGEGYTGYEPMAQAMGLDNFTFSASAANGTEGRVIAAKAHLMHAETMLYAIEIDGKSYIYGEDGLALVSKGLPQLKNDWSFEGSVQDKNALKALCILIGYKAPDATTAMENWEYVTASRFNYGAVAYSHVKRTHHFDTLGALVLWLLDDKAELRLELEQKLAEVAALQELLAA